MTNMSRQEYREFAEKLTKAKGKFGAIKAVVDGITFDSRAEARRYGELNIRFKAGELGWLECHPKFFARVNGIDVCEYTADFRYVLTVGFSEGDAEGPDTVVEDVKSKGTRRCRDWPLRKRLIEAACGITITEVLR